MANTLTSKLSIGQPSEGGGLTGMRGKMALRWVQAFWILFAVIIAGATSFQEAVIASIASTPHPELVYAIFAVATVAAVLLAILLHDFLKEQFWFYELRASSPQDQDRMISERARSGSMTYFYRVYMQTRGLPLAIRQPALEDEMNGVESQMFGHLALPNLLSGSLVGLGLVGTFIGLLQTLSELSGVFAALGNSSGGDSGAMFSTMIVKLQGPMQGMGTAFVASLYGLLGSLVIGLTVSSVKAAGERLFRDVREFINEDLYPSAGVSVLGLQPGDTEPSRSLSIDQWAQLFAVIREEHRSMRDLFIQWEQSFSKRFDQLANVATNLNHQLVETVDLVGEQAERNADRLKEVSDVEGRLAAAIDEKGSRVVEQIDSFRKDLTIAQKSVLPVFGRVALVLAVIGALAGLAAAALSLRSGSSDAPTAAPSPVAAPAPVSTAPSDAGAVPDAPAAPDQITVVAGDSLDKIARARGVPLDALIQANPQLANPQRLFPGDKVNLPAAAPVE